MLIANERLIQGQRGEKVKGGGFRREEVKKKLSRGFKGANS